jgi:uncharacterized protein (DUF1810 family)
LRALLRFFLETPDNHHLLTFSLSSSLYRLFSVLLASNLSRSALDTVFGQPNSRTYQALLTLFEIALFNKQAIKEVKSSTLIIHREKLFEYF